MRRIILITVFLVMIFVRTSNVNAQNIVANEDDITVLDSGKCGDYVTWTLTSDYVLKISGNGEFMTPKKNEMWDKYSQDIIEVIIDEGITNIPNAAFGGYGRSYKKLRSVSISGSVKSIGFAAFEAAALTSVEIPVGVTKIDLYAFNSCKELESIKISNTVNWKLRICGYGHKINSNT